jgi:hypothetical protein
MLRDRFPSATPHDLADLETQLLAVELLIHFLLKKAECTRMCCGF